MIDIGSKTSYKTIKRNGHTSICSSVQFRPGKQWELLTGGLDSTVNHWDYSRPRKLEGACVRVSMIACLHACVSACLQMLACSMACTRDLNTSPLNTRPSPSSIQSLQKVHSLQTSEVNSHNFHLTSIFAFLNLNLCVLNSYADTHASKNWDGWARASCIVHHGFRVDDGCASTRCFANVQPSFCVRTCGFFHW